MSRLATGLDRLLDEAPRRLAGCRYALLAHGASVTADLVPAHLALARSAAGAPALLLGPEHGFYAVEQDMVPAGDQTDPWTGAPVASLYGDSPDSLEPAPGLFDEVDLLLVDLQDVGSRYYTYAATALWAAEAALTAGREVWVLDRPNPLGGDVVEGPPVRPGFDSFVGAFPVPVRHGLSVGELLRLESRRRGLGEGLTVWRASGWDRGDGWEATGRPWVPPSPNMPTAETAWLYPGGCLVEATRISEGRGTTRPFHRIGAPGVDPLRLVGRLAARLAEDPELSGRSAGDPFPASGAVAVPIYFRPWHQKHAGALCGGVELLVTDRHALRPYRLGVHLIAALAEAAPEAFGWRAQPYEFVADRPAIDLLTGSDEFRLALESGSGLEEWLASWPSEEEGFLEERRPALLYPEPESPGGVA